MLLSKIYNILIQIQPFFYLGVLGDKKFYLGDAWKDCVIETPPAQHASYYVTYQL